MKKKSEKKSTAKAKTKKVDKENKRGRPVIYKTAEEMSIKIDAYFDEAESRWRPMITKKGDLIRVPAPAPVHITGLCDYLDISNETLNQYQKKPEFSEPITRAKRKCEAYAVSQLFEGQKGNKADFVLKNNFKENWQEKTQVENTNTTKIIYIDKEEREAYEDHINKVLEE